MAWDGPVAALQSTSADLYSSKQPFDIEDMIIPSLNHSPIDSLWPPTQKPEPTSMNEGVPPDYQSSGDGQLYAYNNGSIAMSDSTNFLSGLRPLDQGYVPMENYTTSTFDPVPNASAFTNVYGNADMASSNEGQLAGNQQLGEAGFDESLGVDVGFPEFNTTAITNTLSVDTNVAVSASEFASPVNYAPPSATSISPRHQVAAGSAEPSSVIRKTVACTSYLQTPKIHNPNSSEPSSPYMGRGGQHNQLGHEDNTLSPDTYRFHAVQSQNMWDPVTAITPQYSSAFNIMGSPFETSPLSSMNPSPFANQLEWSGDIRYVDSQSDLSWPNLQNSFHSDYEIIPDSSRLLLTRNDNYDIVPMPQDPLSNNQAEIRSKTKLSKDHPKIDDYLRSFPSAPDAASRKRKREKFTTEGARKVRSVRNKGACVACHYRKTPCSVDEICAHCLKAVKNDYSLAKEICVRNKMQDSYFGVKTIFGSLEARKGALDPLLQSLSGNSYPVELSVKSSIGSSDTAVLPLRVRQCDLGRTCRWKGLSKVKGIYITSKSIYAPRYAVIPGCVSFANVEKFSCQVLSLSLSHSGGITRFLDDFMSTYSHYSRSTELREFVRSSRSVVGLNGLVSYGSLEIRDGSYELLNLPPTDIPFVGPTVHDQIRLLAAGGLEIAEKTVFSQIDSFKKLVGPNKHARIVGGICLLRLLLLYRDRVLRDAIRVSLPREKILHRERLEQSSFMYRRLTVAYGILCRDANTPITTSWVAESDSVKWTKEDNILQTQFSRLQDAYKDFCDTLTDEHDDLFKGVVVNSRP